MTNRRVWQIHLSTLVLGITMLGLAIGSNLSTHTQRYRIATQVVTMKSGGWPLSWEYSVSIEDYSGGDFIALGPEYVLDATRRSIGYRLLNPLLCLLIVLMTFVLPEYIIRRREFRRPDPPR